MAVERLHRGVGHRNPSVTENSGEQKVKVVAGIIQVDWANGSTDVRCICVAEVSAGIS